MRPEDAPATVTAHRGGGTAGASSPSRGTKGWRPPLIELVEIKEDVTLSYSWVAPW